jgi:hypothetical protein
VTRGTSWRYLVGSSTPNVAWKGLGYNDSSWPPGPSGFGYGDGDDATIVPAGTITVYTRKTFTIDDVSELVGARLHVDYDDAFVAYVNGVEVARANIGNPGDLTSVGQTATRDREAQMATGGDPVSFSLVSLDALFVTGDNVLAVEVHNVGSGSSDLSLIPFLTLATAAPEVSLAGVDPEIVHLFDAFSAHTNFSVSDGETVCLTPPGGLGADCMEVPDGPSDISFGRDPADGSVGFFEYPTPGSANAPIAYGGQAPAVLVSHDAGFYAAPFTLTLSSPDPAGRIAYTTDGSDPPVTATLTAAAVPVSETRVVRARLVVPGMLPGPIVTRTFIFEPTRTLPVVSISTTPANLWDWETGIYVLGPNAEPANPHFGANYWQEWEIPVHMEWFEPGGSFGYGVDAGMQIYGAWSRAHAQKSVALYARGRYGANAFEYPFFAERAFDSYQNILYRNSGNDWNYSMLRDGFMQTLVRRTEIDRMAYRPTVQYLNGEYWGILNAREKINEHYVANIGSVEPDAIDMLEFNVDRYVLHGDAAHWDALISYVTASDMTAPEDLVQVERRMDLDNWIDYQIAQIFIDNRDWPGNNQKMWRPRTEDGRWRWIMFDTDFGFGIYNSSAYTLNTLEFAMEPNGPSWPNPPGSTLLLRRLHRNGGFRTLFVNRFADFLNTHFTVDRMEAVLDSLSGAIQSEIPLHTARWGAFSTTSWDNEIARMRTFARQRPAYMLGHVQAKFGVGSRSHVAVAVAEPGGGTVRVNREHVGAGPWAGLYFVGIPVPVTAIPDPGYRFVGWTGSLESLSATVQVDPSGGVSLFAHFEPGAAVSGDIVINEIQYHAADDQPSGDWVELFNLSQEEVDLSGWTLTDGAPANVFTVPQGASVAPGGYVVLCQDQVAFALVYGSVSCLGGWTFGLSAGGESLFLRDASGAIADSLTFQDALPWPPEADGAGPTLELVDATADNALPESWQAAYVRGGTPGAKNSTSIAIDAPPELPNGKPRIAAFPNPFAGRASLTVEGPATGEAVVEIFDALGRRLGRMELGRLDPGPNTLAWPADAGAPGLRFVRLLVDGRPVAATKVVRID